MPTKKHSTQAEGKKPGKGKKTVSKKLPSAQKHAARVKPLPAEARAASAEKRARQARLSPAKAKTAPAKKGTVPIRASPDKALTIPVQAPSMETLKKTIAYFYLLSFCPPARITDFIRSTAPLRRALAESARMSETAYFEMIIPQVCWRIVAFHQDTREPSQQWINALVNTAREADESPQKASAFQQEMSRITQLPGRAKPESRLHRKKGCAMCQLPCFYGYFTLVSDPQFSHLQELFIAENKKPKSGQTPLTPIYRFTLNHIAGLIGTQVGYILAEHLANLSYCLLLLGTAKSRMIVPEEQLRLFQAANQDYVRRLRAGTSTSRSS